MTRILSERKQLEVLRLLMEGNSINSVWRLTGVHRGTMSRLMNRFGEACRRFVDREMRDLALEHVQVDELWTFCRKKDWTVKRDGDQSEGIGSFYLFVALDEATRLIPSYLLGNRDDKSAILLMEDLYDRLRKRKPHESDDHAFNAGIYEPIIRISTDGFNSYPEAIQHVFAAQATHGVLKKFTSGRRLDHIEKRSMSGNIPEEQITTSLVERSNLTTRNFIRRFARRTMCYSKKIENLKSAIHVHMAAYNYCWTIHTLKTTPAVAAGLVSSKWSHADLYDHLRDRWPELFFLESAKMSA